MNVLIIAPYATVAPHFETELEIAQRHLDQGHHVTMLSCLGELPGCDFNPKGASDKCRDCKLRRLHGLDQLRGRVKSRSFKAFNDLAELSALPESASASDLKQLVLDEFDWGFGALSSLVSFSRDPDPDLRFHREQLHTFLLASQRVYRQVSIYLERYRVDRVYVFNGRFAAMRAVLRACQAHGTACFVHERGCDTAHYQLYENHLPHEIPYVESRIRQAWERASPDEASLVGATWFENRVKRVETSWHSFVKDQTAGSLPEEWRAERHNLALFTSSEDEFVAIGDCWKNHLYKNQLGGIVELAQSLGQLAPNAHLTVRVHPNLKQVQNRQTMELLNLRMPNVTIVTPESEVDSYHLMRACDSVVTFGSSMGIEAVFWGKPSILLGPSFYRGLGGTYQPANHVQAMELLKRPLPSLEKSGALMYGYWMASHGYRFHYFEPSGLFSGTFKGREIYPKPRKTMHRRLTRQLWSVRKRLRRWFGRSGRPRAA